MKDCFRRIAFFFWRVLLLGGFWFALAQFDRPEPLEKTQLTTPQQLVIRQEKAESLGTPVNGWYPLLNSSRSVSGYVLFSKSDTAGYHGSVPLYVVFDPARHVKKVELLQNQEDPSFLNLVKKSGLLQKWDGLSPEEIAEKKVDFVSGATYSSRAVIAGVQSIAEKNGAEMTGGISWRQVCGWAGLLIAVVWYLFFWKRYPQARPVILISNVILSGVIAGTFFSFANLDGLMTSVSSRFLLLAAVGAALILPVLTGRDCYCAWICPFGSAQELCGKWIDYRIPVPEALDKILLAVRLLWGILFMGLIALGVPRLFQWELFPSMIVPFWKSGGLLAGLLIVLGLSCVLPRPYCRYYCPSGILIALLTRAPKKRQRRPLIRKEEWDDEAEEGAGNDNEESAAPEK